MEFSEKWKYFHEHHGLCPACKKTLVPQFGCINSECVLLKENIEEKACVRNMFSSHIRHKEKEKRYWEETKAFLRKVLMEYRAKNVDKAYKKGYI